MLRTFFFAFHLVSAASCWSGETSLRAERSKTFRCGQEAFPVYPLAFSWSDGFPTAAASDSPTGIYVQGEGNGFSITVPPTGQLIGARKMEMKIYVGAWEARGYAARTPLVAERRAGCF